MNMTMEKPVRELKSGESYWLVKRDYNRTQKEPTNVENDTARALKLYSKTYTEAKKEAEYMMHKLHLKLDFIGVIRYNVVIDTSDTKQAEHIGKKVLKNGDWSMENRNTIRNMDKMGLEDECTEMIIAHEPYAWNEWEMFGFDKNTMRNVPDWEFTEEQSRAIRERGRELIKRMGIDGYWGKQTAKKMGVKYVDRPNTTTVDDL